MVNRMPFYRVDFLGMTLESIEFAECTDIEKLDTPVPACGRYQVSGRCPFTRVDGGFVGVSAKLAECPSNFESITGKAYATYSVLNSLPVLGSQNLTSISLEPDASKPLLGCQSTHRTSQP